MIVLSARVGPCTGSDGGKQHEAHNPASWPTHIAHVLSPWEVRSQPNSAASLTGYTLKTTCRLTRPSLANRRRLCSWWLALRR